MCDVSRILRAQELETRYNRYYRLANKKHTELDSFQRECMHEIVVTTEYNDSYNIPQKCLFCCKESSTHQGFYGSHAIDVSSVESMEYLDPDEKFETVRKLFVKIATENPKLSIKEVQQMVESEIANPTKLFWSVKHDIYFRNTNLLF